MDPQAQEAIEQLQELQKQAEQIEVDGAAPRARLLELLADRDDLDAAVIGNVVAQHEAIGLLQMQVNSLMQVVIALAGSRSAAA